MLCMFIFVCMYAMQCASYHLATGLVSLLGLSWWYQLHTGQVRCLGNTNGSMKALCINSDMVT